jgi:hypothetical protein
MRKQTALIVILILAIAGMLFSGYLSYSELFSATCKIGGCVTVGSLPACFYGFIMYLALFIIALVGIRGK